MPVPLNTTAPITIAPSKNLDIFLPIVNATSIDIHGYIESANFTNLQHYTSMDLSTNTNFNCERFLDHFIFLKYSYPAVENSTYTCKSGPPSQFISKQTLALGLGLGVPLSIIASVLVWWTLIRNAAAKKRKAVDAALRGSELSNVVPARREPEGSREGQEPVGGGTAGHRPGHSHRPETPPPPPYSAT
ncbi:hypothetical protein BDW69DRAFT_179696 [Aspergillus filifer]